MKTPPCGFNAMQLLFFVVAMCSCWRHVVCQPHVTECIPLEDFLEINAPNAETTCTDTGRGLICEATCSEGYVRTIPPGSGPVQYTCVIFRVTWILWDAYTRNFIEDTDLVCELDSTVCSNNTECSFAGQAGYCADAGSCAYVWSDDVELESDDRCCLDQSQCLNISSPYWYPAHDCCATEGDGLCGLHEGGCNGDDNLCDGSLVCGENNCAELWAMSNPNKTFDGFDHDCCVEMATDVVITINREEPSRLIPSGNGTYEFQLRKGELWSDIYLLEFTNIALGANLSATSWNIPALFEDFDEFRLCAWDIPEDAPGYTPPVICIDSISVTSRSSNGSSSLGWSRTQEYYYDDYYVGAPIGGKCVYVGSYRGLVTLTQEYLYPIRIAHGQCISWNTDDPCSPEARSCGPSEICVKHAYGHACIGDSSVTTMATPVPSAPRSPTPAVTSAPTSATPASPTPAPTRAIITIVQDQGVFQETAVLATLLSMLIVCCCLIVCVVIFMISKARKARDATKHKVLYSHSHSGASHNADGDDIYATQLTPDESNIHTAAYQFTPADYGHVSSSHKSPSQHHNQAQHGNDMDTMVSVHTSSSTRSDPFVKKRHESDALLAKRERKPKSPSIVRVTTLPVQPMSPHHVERPASRRPKSAVPGESGSGDIGRPASRRSKSTVPVVSGGISHALDQDQEPEISSREKVSYAPDASASASDVDNLSSASNDGVRHSPGSSNGGRRSTGSRHTLGSNYHRHSDRRSTGSRHSMGSHHRHSPKNEYGHSRHSPLSYNRSPPRSHFFSSSDSVPPPPNVPAPPEPLS